MLVCGVPRTRRPQAGPGQGLFGRLTGILGWAHARVVLEHENVGRAPGEPSVLQDRPLAALDVHLDEVGRGEFGENVVHTNADGLRPGRVGLTVRYEVRSRLQPCGELQLAVARARSRTDEIPASSQRVRIDRTLVHGGVLWVGLVRLDLRVRPAPERESSEETDVRAEVDNIPGVL